MVVCVGGVLAVQAREANAYLVCGGDVGWASDGAQLAPHPRVVYWTNKFGTGQGLPPAESLVAKIDGKPVATHVVAIENHPNKLAVIEIESDATGALTLDWVGGSLPSGHYKIAATAYPKVAHATTSRFHGQPRVPGEALDGLEISVDAPAMRAIVKLRRDAKATWRVLDVPVEAGGKLRIGMLGCTANYEPQLLEQGVDIAVTLVMADGKSIPVDQLTHVKIGGLAKPTSDKPGDAE